MSGEHHPPMNEVSASWLASIDRFDCFGYVAGVKMGQQVPSIVGLTLNLERVSMARIAIYADLTHSRSKHSRASVSVESV